MEDRVKRIKREIQEFVETKFDELERIESTTTEATPSEEAAAASTETGDEFEQVARKRIEEIQTKQKRDEVIKLCRSVLVHFMHNRQGISYEDAKKAFDKLRSYVVGDFFTDPDYWDEGERSRFSNGKTIAFRRYDQLGYLIGRGNEITLGQPIEVMCGEALLRNFDEFVKNKYIRVAQGGGQFTSVARFDDVLMLSHDIYYRDD